ncbi:MAG: MFS transporter [Salinirussus sp.]
MTYDVCLDASVVQASAESEYSDSSGVPRKVRQYVSALRFAFGDEADVLSDRQFQVILLANIIAPSGTALLSPVLDSLIAPFGASAANVGLMISMITAPAIVMLPISGVIADRAGRRPVLLGGLLAFGIGGTAIAATTDFRVALALRFLQGLGWAAIMAVIITSIGDLYTGAREATAQGLRFTGSGLVQALSPLVAGVLVLLAWQLPFLVYGISFPVALAVFLWFEEPARTVTDQQRTLGRQVAELRALATQPRAAALVIARGTPGIVWLGFLTFNSILVLNVLGGSPADAGILASLGSICYAVSATQAGRLTDAVDSRVGPMILLHAIMTGGIALVFLSPSVPIAYPGIALVGLGLGTLMSMYRSILTGLAPTALRGGLVSLGESVGRLAVTLTPIVMGLGIAVGTPRIGFQLSVQLVGVGTGIAASIIGVGGLLIARAAPPIVDPR